MGAVKTGRWTLPAILAALFVALLAGCGDDGTTGGPDAARPPDGGRDATIQEDARPGDATRDGTVGCSPATCPEGCCLAGECLAPSAAHCGLGGAACVDCTADGRADSCDQGQCVCAAAGRLCDAGEHCTANGCEAGCVPSCAGKCAGADDGCGGTCADNDCSGCCTSDHQCLPGTSDSACGSGGWACRDCASRGRTCGNGGCLSSLTNDAAFAGQEVPESVQPGASFQVVVAFRNVGTATWTAAQEYKLGSQNFQDNGRWGLGRVELGAGEQVAPGQVKEFRFTVTAPSAPGFHPFQWRMLRERVEWFGEYSPTVVITIEPSQVSVCQQAANLANTGQDASGAIQACLDSAPAGGVVELPVGVYALGHQVLLRNHPVTLRTQGRSFSDPRCAEDGSDCAVLRALPSFGDELGLVRLLASGSRVDHLVIDGNKENRWQTPSGQQCRSGNNRFGHNVQMPCDGCSFTNSVTKNTLCGTGLEVAGLRTGVVVWRNLAAHNGIHDEQGLWADGITVHDAVESSFTDNEFVDNTDVDFVFGGCHRCTIQGNVFSHSADFQGSSFTALMVHAWSDDQGTNLTSGDFTDTGITDNLVDCGPSHQCGFGLYLGSDAWYIADVFGGEVFRNEVRNAQLGLLLDDVHDTRVYDNRVSGTRGWTRGSCGRRTTWDYVMGNRTANVDTSRDLLGSVFHSDDWDHCIPNWWNP